MENDIIYGEIDSNYKSSEKKCTTTTDPGQE